MSTTKGKPPVGVKHDKQSYRQHDLAGFRERQHQRMRANNWPVPQQVEPAR